MGPTQPPVGKSLSFCSLFCKMGVLGDLPHSIARKFNGVLCIRIWDITNAQCIVAIILKTKNFYLESWALRVLLHLGGLLPGACAGGNQKGQEGGKGLSLLTLSWMVTDSQRTLSAFILFPGDGPYGNNGDSEAGESVSQDFCWKPQGDIVLATLLTELAYQTSS